MRRRYLKGIGVGIGSLVTASENGEAVSGQDLSVRIVETNAPIGPGDVLEAATDGELTTETIRYVIAEEPVEGEPPEEES